MIKNFATGLILMTMAVLVPGTALSQVSNNRIENRIPLDLDSEAFTSTTTHSDVQWDCINKALTKKCLVYHNDQWFTMTPPTIGPYYINIHNQSCKNAYGVQLVILEGDPCKTDSYQLKRCVPFSDQSDFYVKLDSLRPNTEYLVNVDGFLGDLCTFKIEFSSSLRGTPVNPSNTKLLNTVLTLKDSIVQLHWTVDDSLAFTVKDFQLYRKRDKDKASKQIPVPLFHNAYGAMKKDYDIYDTLREKGTYSYQVFGSTHDDMLLLSQVSISYPQEKPRKVARRIRSMQREFVYYAPKAELVTVYVLDASNGRRLFSTSRRADKGRNVLVLNFAEMVDEGVYDFKIMISGKTVAEEHMVKIDPPK